jgi:hypothetical protein
MKVISYYELLEMIKNGNIPKVVNYKITGYIENYIEYTAQYDGDTFTHYELTNHNREDENIRFFLNENYLESDMFDESILIIEDKSKEDKKIEDTARFQYSQIPSWFDIKELIKAVNENFEKHQKALNEIIDKVNGK